MKKLILVLMLVFLLNKDVYAYLFPGAGQAIIGSLWPLIVAIVTTVSVFIIKHFWKPIKKYVLRK